jgi:hypothetical protein
MIKGKALLIIERLDSAWVPFDVVAYIQSCSIDDSCPVQDNFECLNTDTLPLPRAAYKLKTGDKIWISVVYEFNYHQDYWGELDVDLEYHKERVLKKRI